MLTTNLYKVKLKSIAKNYLTVKLYPSYYFFYRKYIMSTQKDSSKSKPVSTENKFLPLFFKGLSIVALSAIGAGSVMYACQNCPSKEAKLTQTINSEIAKYIDSNPKLILEKLAKSENFGNTVKAFSPTSDDELKIVIADFFQNNSEVLDTYIRDKSDFIAEVVKSSEVFKDIPQNNETVEASPSEEASSPTDENQKYKDNWDKLANSEVAPYVGPKDAKVTVVEFFDFACGHCKSLAPVIAELIKRNPDVKFVFNPLYFMSDASPYASKVSFAAFQKDKFLPVFEGIMTLPNMTEETINQILVDEGLNVDEIKTMIEEKKIRRGVQDIDALSQVLGINGVPMLLINGEAYYGRNIDDIHNKINSLK